MQALRDDGEESAGPPSLADLSSAAERAAHPPNEIGTAPIPSPGGQPSDDVAPTAKANAKPLDTLLAKLNGPPIRGPSTRDAKSKSQTKGACHTHLDSSEQFPLLITCRLHANAPSIRALTHPILCTCHSGGVMASQLHTPEPGANLERRAPLSADGPAGEGRHNKASKGGSSCVGVTWLGRCSRDAATLSAVTAHARHMSSNCPAHHWSAQFPHVTCSPT